MGGGAAWRLLQGMQVVCRGGDCEAPVRFRSIRVGPKVRLTLSRVRRNGTYLICYNRDRLARLLGLHAPERPVREQAAEVLGGGDGLHNA